jgi:VanZ family protein
MALIFAMSSRSQVAQPLGLSAVLLSIVAHLVLYGALAILFLHWLASDHRPDRATIFVAVGLTALYGLSDEIHQSFVAGRDASPLDLVVNTFGAALAAMGWSVRRSIKAAIRQR